MAALRNIVVVPLVAFILVHGASIYNSNEGFTCGGTRCPSGTVACAVNENTNSNNQTTITEMCLGNSGNVLSKSSKTFPYNQVPTTGLWWNSTWGNGTGFWNWTRTHLKTSNWEQQAKKDIHNTLGNIEHEINKIKGLLH